ncbi:hypothetical protein A4X09_0g4694 [Tilletia walkeri]|uniref:Uncharacterized protein n=1 Tax=Tilletia walkeri TaxID=117179 RepID=A0A8X7T3M1_9BASI|nr:hypothetical protein A4X09_0g4694 [Tilletia walkeri]
MDPTSSSGFASANPPPTPPQLLTNVSSASTRTGAQAPNLFEFADFGQLTLDPFGTDETSEEGGPLGGGPQKRPGMHRIPTHHSSYDDADSEHHAQLIDRAAQQARSPPPPAAATNEDRSPGSSASAANTRSPPIAPSAQPIDYNTSRTFAKRLSSGRMSRFSSIGSLKGVAASQAQADEEGTAGTGGMPASTSKSSNSASAETHPLPRPPAFFNEASPGMSGSGSGSPFQSFSSGSQLPTGDSSGRMSRQSVIEYQRRAGAGMDDDGLAEAEALAISGGRSTPAGSKMFSGDDNNEGGAPYPPRPTSRSSFFGLDPPAPISAPNGPASQAEKIAAYHRATDSMGAGGGPGVGGANEGQQKGYRQSTAAILAQGITAPAPQGISSSAPSPREGQNGGSYNHQSAPSSGGGGGGMGGMGPSGSTRPPSIAPTINSSYGGTAGSIYGAGMLLDHRHLQPGKQAALLSHEKTLELYRLNAKKTNDPNLMYEFAVFMIDAAKSMAAGAEGGEEGKPGTAAGAGAPGKEGGLTATAPGALPMQVNSRSASPVANGAREELVKEAIGLLKRIADRGHADAQYFLGDCYANGIGTPKAKHDFDRAYPLFVLAAKHGHPDAAYRAGTCYEKGWGCRKDAGKALQFYRKAASPGDAGGHPGAMYRLATAELNGELGCKKSVKEGVKWLKRSAEAATPEFPHALHELALLHERGIDNVLFVDPEYSCELLAQAAELGYAPSAYKLGVNYEYGRMGCPQDAGLSIHMYNIAAQQGHKEACFALTAWYLVGAPGILPQSDTEAYLWAKKAAEQGLGKAEYAVGYFTEMGIGTVRDLTEAKAWYKRAQEHGDKRANQRLAALGSSNGQGLGFNRGQRNGSNGPPPPIKTGISAAQQQGERQRILREQQDTEEARLAGLRDDARSAKENQRVRTQQAKNKRQFDFVAPPEDMRVSQYGLPDANRRAAAAAAAAAANNRQSVAPSERPMSQMPTSMQDFRASGYGNSFGAPGVNGQGPFREPASAGFYAGPGGGGGGQPQGRPVLPMSAGQAPNPNPNRKSSLPPPGIGQGQSAYPTYEQGQSILKKNPSSSPPPPGSGGRNGYGGGGGGPGSPPLPPMSAPMRPMSGMMSPGRGGGPPGQGQGGPQRPGLDTRFSNGGRSVSGPQSAGVMPVGYVMGPPGPQGGWGGGPPPPQQQQGPPGGYRSPTQQGPPAGLRYGGPPGQMGPGGEGGGPPAGLRYGGPPGQMRGGGEGGGGGRLPGGVLPPGGPVSAGGEGKKKGGWFSK